MSPTRCIPNCPAPFLKTLGQALTQVTDFLLANPTRMDGELQDFYFEALHFSRMAEAFGEHSLFDVTLQSDTGPGAFGQALGQPLAVLNIRNVVPAPFLAPRFAAAQSAALFSATLSPQNYYADTLGLPGRHGVDRGGVALPGRAVAGLGGQRRFHAFPAPGRLARPSST